MTDSLGTMEDLPKDYRAAMQAAGVAPLWPMMRNVLPHGAPATVTQTGHWTYSSVRPLLLQAGELTPVQRAGGTQHKDLRTVAHVPGAK